jgi:hypothetical protein
LSFFKNGKLLGEAKEDGNSAPVNSFVLLNYLVNNFVQNGKLLGEAKEDGNSAPEAGVRGRRRQSRLEKRRD